MGFRFRKSIKVLPGIRLNVGKHGINSVSVGSRGVTTNIGKHGTHTTYSIPGTGISYRSGSHRSGGQRGGLGCLGLCFFAFIALGVLGTFTHQQENSLSSATVEQPLVAAVASSPTPAVRLVEKNAAMEDNALQSTPAPTVHRHRRHHHYVANE